MSPGGGNLATTGLLLVLLSSPGPVAAAEPMVEVCLSAPGFSEDVTSAIRRIVAERLQAHQVMQVTGMTGAGPGGCCLTRRCLRAAAEAGLRGVLEIQVLRFGPLVRISLEAHESSEAKTVVQIKASAKAKGFPGSAETLSSDLDRGLASLGIALRPRPVPKAGQTKPAPRPGPPPSQPKQRLGLSNAPPQAANPQIDEQRGPMSTSARAADRRPTYFWVGGSLSVGGVLLAAVGIYMLADPLQDALDRRRWARDAWLEATEPVDVARYHDKMMAADDRARRDNLIGWLGVGCGAALATAGVLTMLLAPAPAGENSGPTDQASFSVTPRLGPGGAGLALAWTF